MRKMPFAIACVLLLASCAPPEPASPPPAATPPAPSPTFASLTSPVYPTPLDEKASGHTSYPYPLPPFPSPEEPWLLTPSPPQDPFPSGVPLPTTMPTPHLVLTLIPASEARIPHLTFDLQYQAGDRIFRLRHESGKIEVFLELSPWNEGVANPRLYYRGEKIIRSSGAGFSEAKPYGIQTWEVIDLKTGRSQVVRSFDTGPGKEWISRPEVSPDGNWFAYCRADWGQEFTFTHFEMVLVSTGAPFMGRTLGPCDENSQVFWSPESQYLIWAAADGIWSASPASPAKLILSYTQGQWPVYVLREPQWSPSGPYVIISHLGTIEGGSRAILDVQMGQTEDIPDTWEYTIPAARVNWLPGDRLVSIKPGDWAANSFPIQVYLWQLQGNGPQMLSLEGTFPVGQIDPNFMPFSPMQIDMGRVLFAVLPDENVSHWSFDLWEGGIYSINPGDPAPQKLNTLPAELRLPWNDPMNWLPDGSGVLMAAMMPDGRKMLYIPADNSPIFDLTSLLGEDACCFTWLP